MRQSVVFDHEIIDFDTRIGQFVFEIDLGVGHLGGCHSLELFMKKVVSALTALALLAPSVASAATVSQSLSVKSAAVKPVRTAAKQGDNKAIATPILLLLIAAAGGIIYAVADGDSR